MSRYIQRLIEQGENQHLDFKYKISDVKKIARTFSAFANTEGGKLLVGVKDNGKIAGIETDEEAYMLESAAHIYCRPRVNFNIKNWRLEGKNILEVTIEESNKKPHLAPWKNNLWRAFVRVNDENFVANSVLVEVWKKKRADQAIFIEYNKSEKQLLEYLEYHKHISMKEVCKISMLSYPAAKKMLTNLALAGIIKICTEEYSTTYSLNPTVS
ncbi:MAG: ATP-binding protein [Bacteroidales bacterium]|nr:ATP-binding protein [Bacteroidales bacterium]